MRVLVTGSTGYVGSRLVAALLAAGHDVVAAARRPERLDDFDWRDDVTVVELDVLDASSCRSAFETVASSGNAVDVAYYLVHAIGEGDFAARDREGAEHFAAAAASVGVGRIVYLGGFVPDGETLSEHLDSRAETAEVLERHGVPVVWVRAAVIIGGGSTSFEIIRYLADRLPVLPIPEWMSRPVQPIAVDDVLYYLVAAASVTVPSGGYDIGGDEVLPYRDLLQRYVQAAGLRRWLVPARGVAPGLAALVVGRLTPVPAALTADLIDSLRNTMVGDTAPIRRYVPDPPGGLTGIDKALRRALAPANELDTVARNEHDPPWAGGDADVVTVERRVEAPVGTVWDRLEDIGGRRGFEGWPVAWRSRGVARRLLTGTGIGWSRASEDHLTVGDVLDDFTVATIDVDRRLVLRSSEASPSSLEFEIEPDGTERCTLRVTYRAPVRGAAGRLSGWGRRPLDQVGLAAMARVIARDARDGTSRAE